MGFISISSFKVPWCYVSLFRALMRTSCSIYFPFMGILWGSSFSVVNRTMPSFRWEMDSRQSLPCTSWRLDFFSSCICCNLKWNYNYKHIEGFLQHWYATIVVVYKFSFRRRKSEHLHLSNSWPPHSFAQAYFVLENMWNSNLVSEN